MRCLAAVVRQGRSVPASIVVLGPSAKGGPQMRERHRPNKKIFLWAFSNRLVQVPVMATLVAIGKHTAGNRG